MKFNSNIFNECKCQDFDLLNESMNVAKSREHERAHICQSILTPIHAKANLQAICSCYFVGPCLV